MVDGIQRDLFSIDPENIESITVLKDALSTLALGQRSSRGVVLITTKKPQIGRTMITFNAKDGLKEPLSFPPPSPTYQYAYLLNESLPNTNTKPAYADQNMHSFPAGADPYNN